MRWNCPPDCIDPDCLDPRDVDVLEAHHQRQMNRHRISGGILFGSSAIALILLLGIGYLIIVEVDYRSTQQREICERRVDTRDDHRYMWERAIELFPDSPAGPILREHLDDRLPPLHCDDRTVRPFTEPED